MPVLPGILEALRISFGKGTNFEVKGNVAQIKINAVVFAVIFRLDVGVGTKYLQNLIMGMVVEPAAQGVGDEGFNIQSMRLGDCPRLALNTLERFDLVDKAA